MVEYLFLECLESNMIQDEKVALMKFSLKEIENGKYKTPFWFYIYVSPAHFKNNKEGENMFKS